MPTPIKSNAKATTAPPSKKAPWYLHLSTHDKTLFLKHLTVMLEAGIPLRNALKTILLQKNSSTLKYVVETAAKDLADGRQLSYTLNKFPQLFDSFFISSIQVGESSGTLSTTLQYLGKQMEKSASLKSQVRGALIYPFIVLLGAIGIAIYLAFFLLPQLLPLFQTLAVDLPLSTRVLLWTTTAIRTQWPFLLFGTLGLIGAVYAVWRLSFAVRLLCHRVLLFLPVAGHLSREIQINQFARVLGTLLTSGTHIVDALEIASSAATNLVYQQQFKQMQEAVKRGETMTAELTKHPHLFSHTVISLVTIGEQTGSLPKSLMTLGEFSERDIEDTIKNLTILIEPFILLLMGALVGFIALSIITPIYQLTQGVVR